MEKQTQVLSGEHKIILKVISALKEECARLNLSKKIDKEFFEKTIDFIRNYADKFHHAKEEDILFVEFCKNAHKAHCNPVDQMLYEHKQGREYVKNMETAVLNGNIDDLVKNASGYAELLEEHIFKEDTILYPMMDEVFDEETQQSIAERSKVAEEKFGKEFIAKYLEFANNLM